MKVLAGLLPASLGVAAVIGLAATAHAEPASNDTTFLGSLQQSGITFSNPAQAVAAGRGVCGMMTDGTPGIQVVSELAQRNPGFSLDAAAQFTRLAANAYCPQQLA